MKNARRKNCARFPCVCAASDSHRIGGNPAIVSRNRTCALAIWHHAGLMDGSRPCGTALAMLMVGEPRNPPIRPFLVPDRPAGTPER